MKKFISFILIISVIFIFGCKNVKDRESSSNDSSVNGRETSSSSDLEENGLKGYLFKYNDAAIAVDEDMSLVLKVLGEPVSYYEAPSCAYQGMDKVYTYMDFEIDTYSLENTENAADYISAIILKNDMVETAEGIYIGCTLDEVKSAYGNNYREDEGMLVYTKDGMELMFIIEDDGIVSSIQYFSTILSH